MMLNYWHCLTEWGLWLTVEALTKDNMYCKAASERMKENMLKFIQRKNQWCNSSWNKCTKLGLHINTKVNIAKLNSVLIGCFVQVTVRELWIHNQKEAQTEGQTFRVSCRILKTNVPWCILEEQPSTECKYQQWMW